MVDGVNFNPFTNKAWTDEEIQKLDANGDGKISSSEVSSNFAWLSERAIDDEGAVEISDNEILEVKKDDPLYMASKNSGMTDSANDAAELKNNIAILADEYIEQYMTNHPNLSDSERSSVQTLVSSYQSVFLSQYITENPQGPYDMLAVTSAFKAYMDSIVADNANALESINETMQGYQDNIDNNYNDMVNLADSAISNKNVSNSEYAQIKNKAVQYIIGMMLSGNIDESLLQNINSNYQNSTYWKVAKGAIEKLKTETDPVKIQEYLAMAQTNIAKMLDAMGKDKVVDAIQDTEQARIEEEVTGKLQTVTDTWIENKITADMSDEEKNTIKAFVENSIGKFLAKLTEDGSMGQLNDAQLQSSFKSFIDSEYSKLLSAQETVTRAAGDIETTNNSLISVSDAAKENGNVSDAEKKAIVDVASELVYKQLIAELDTIPLLSALDSNYKSSSEYMELESVITKMKSSVDPDEILKLQEEAKVLIKKLLENYTGDQLASAVDFTKPIELDEATQDDIIYNSSISSDYQANKCRTSGYGKQGKGASLEDIQAQARADMEAVAESLKAQLQKSLGAAYNDELVQQLINDAMNDTIALFTENVSRRKGGSGGNYRTGSDEQAFVFLRKSGWTGRGRYTYNVQALVNTFLEKFNEASKKQKVQQNDPAEITYDRENVISETLGNDYYRNKQVQNHDTSALYETAKAKMKAVAAAIKTSLLAAGCQVSSTEIDEILNDSMQETMDSYNFHMYNGNSILANMLRAINGDSFNTKDLIDDFMNRVDDKLEKAKNKEEDGQQ